MDGGGRIARGDGERQSVRAEQAPKRQSAALGGMGGGGRVARGGGEAAIRRATCCYAVVISPGPDRG
jgi:hypothetical protein